MEHARDTTLTVNGARVTRRIEPRMHLVDFLREELGLTGSHIGCEHGVCGAGATPVLALNAAKQNSLEAAQKALEKDLQPPADLYHSSATKLHLARVLLSRAWNTLSKPH